jgi:hypothetical protein
MFSRKSMFALAAFASAPLMAEAAVADDQAECIKAAGDGAIEARSRLISLTYMSRVKR